MGINYDKWTAIPNSEIYSLCLNKHIPVKIRVLWIIIREILGYAKNRDPEGPGGEVGIGRSILVTKTGASKRQIIRAIKQLEDEGLIQVINGKGRGHITRYRIDLDSG